MAKHKNEATAKIELPKANVYSILTVILTVGLFALAFIAILGLPYLSYTIIANANSLILHERLAITLEDLVEFSYFYPMTLLGNKVEGLLSNSMNTFYQDIILGINPEANYFAITVSSMFIAGGVFEIIFLIYALITFGFIISGFKKGNFKRLRKATRGAGILISITFLPAILLNILFLIPQQSNVSLHFDTIIALVMIVIGIVVESINSASYRNHLKNAVANEKIFTTNKEDEIPAPSFNEVEQETLPESNDAPLEEIKETGSYKVCPNCGKHADVEDLFCEECGQSLKDAVVIKNVNIGEQDCCSCCCGCFEQEETNHIANENIEAEEDSDIKEKEAEIIPPHIEEEETKIAENEDVKVVVVGENGAKVIDRNTELGTRRIVKVIGLPVNLNELGDHRFAKNGQLQIARIPSNITELGIGCFANCYNLEEVYIPLSVSKICANALFNCSKLRKIVYEGSIAQFKNIERQSNWLTSAGTNIITCNDGDIMIE